MLYQLALQGNPHLVEAQNNLGNAYLELGQYADAAGCYRLAIKIAPDRGQLHCNLGNALRQLGLSDEAMASTQQALVLEPGLSVAHNNLGLVLDGTGQRAAGRHSDCTGGRSLWIPATSRRSITSGTC